MGRCSYFTSDQCCSVSSFTSVDAFQNKHLFSELWLLMSRLWSWSSRVASSTHTRHLQGARFCVGRAAGEKKISLGAFFIFQQIFQWEVVVLHVTSHHIIHSLILSVLFSSISVFGIETIRIRCYSASHLTNFRCYEINLKWSFGGATVGSRLASKVWSNPKMVRMIPNDRCAAEQE